MISGLPGKVSRMLVESRGLLDSASVLEAEPGELDIKRCKLGILFTSLQVASLFHFRFSGHGRPH